MKTLNSFRLKTINVIIYITLICLIFGVIVKIWDASNKIAINPQKLDDLNLERPIIRPINDVFFYLKSEVLRNNNELLKEVQQNELLLETITSIVFSVFFILIMLQLKSLFHSLKNKTFFLKENLFCVKRISYLLFLWVITDFIIYQCIQFFIPLSLIAKNINYVPINKNLFLTFLFSVNFSMLIAAFAFYVISVVFREGFSLKQESDLTI